MNPEDLVKDWFQKWENGDYQDLPLTDDFKHTSPFGTIYGRKNYLDLVRMNEDKFLGQTFIIHDIISEGHKACVRYTARQDSDFSLDVSEWHYIRDGLIEQIFAYYHIGEVRKERTLDSDSYN